jgi:UTP:GlnB (protein PII) uridylyltransferase
VLLEAALVLLLAVQPHDDGCGAEQDHAEDGAQDAADNGGHVLVLGEG